MPVEINDENVAEFFPLADEDESNYDIEIDEIEIPENRLRKLRHRCGINLKQLAREAFHKGWFRQRGGDGGRFDIVVLPLSEILK